MRILAMTNLYPNPFQPNRATFNRHQFRLLAKKQSVHVISPIAWTDELQARCRGDSALPATRQVKFDGLIVEHPRYLFPPKVARRWYGRFYRASVKRTFFRVARVFHPDLVFAPWAYPDGWAAVQLARSVRLPVVIQVHGSDILLVDQIPSRRERTVEAVKSSDGVVAVSQDLANRLMGMGVERGRIRVIIDGVDRQTFAPGDKTAERRALPIPYEEGERMLLFVGNLVPVKAIDVLLKACAEPVLKRTRTRLVIVGDGPLRKVLEQNVIQLGLTGRVWFAGAIRQSELPRWYRAADVFVLPSHSEGLPNVLLEASSCGTPWVASRVGGIPEIAHLGNSRLVVPNSPIDLANAIAESLSEPSSALPPGPRPREEAVSDLIEFLSERLCHFRCQTKVTR